MEHELELDILEHISQTEQKVRQRDLAHIIGKSLGMTNAILQRLVQKGMLKVAQANGRSLSYVVTPDGVRELASRSYRFFKRTIKNVVFYKDGIEKAVKSCLQESVPKGSAAVVLLGQSDLDFVVEHVVQSAGLVLLRHTEPNELETVPGLKVVACLLSESASESMRAFTKTRTASVWHDAQLIDLSQIVLGTTMDQERS